MNRRHLRINLTAVMCLFAGLYPIIPRYFDIFGISAVNVLTLGCVVIGGFLARNQKTFTQGQRTNKFSEIAAVFYIVVILISRLMHEEYIEFLWNAMAYLGMGILIYHSVTTRDRFMGMVDAILKASFIVSIFGIIEGFLSINIFTLLFNTSGVELTYNDLRFGARRILGFGTQTITYCAYIMFVMSFCFYRIVNENSKRKKKRLMILYLLLAINAVLTLSRSSIVAIILCQLLLYMGLGTIKFFKTVSGVIIGLVIIGVIPTVMGHDSIIVNAFQSLIALFNSNVAQNISGAFGSDNAGGIGHRLQLYAWILSLMPGHWLLGFGRQGVQNFNYHYDTNMWGIALYKRSIEVEYLATLYAYGVIGLLAEIIAMVSIIMQSIRLRHLRSNWETRIGFGYIMMCTMVTYALLMFAVSRNTEEGIFFLMVMMFFAYKHNLIGKTE